MNGQVDGFIEQRFFKFLDEDAFAAHLRQRRVLHLVAGRFDDDQLRFGAGGLKQLFANELGLPASENTPASANAKMSHGFSRSGRNRSRSASALRILRRSSFSERIRSAGPITRDSSNSSTKASRRTVSEASRFLKVERRSRKKAERCAFICPRKASTRPTISTLACQERNLPTCSSTMDSARGISLWRALRFC